MLPVINILYIIDLGKMIAIINKIKATILTFAIITTTIVINYKEKSVIFVAKKVIALISI